MLNTMFNTHLKATLLLNDIRYFIQASRGHKQWLRPYLKSVYKRRIDQGPEPERPRSAWINWNYPAELFAFGKRLGEEFTESTLKIAFTNRSYIELETEKRTRLGIEGEAGAVTLIDNSALAQSGELVATFYIPAYLRQCLPLLPEDAIRSIMSHLLSDDVIHHVASHLGLNDLILTEEFPPSKATICQTFKAVIGALAHDQGQERAELFIQDFLITQLVAKDLLDIWNISDPAKLLIDTTQRLGLADPEPRLLWSSASETIMAVYVVGIYCNKRLIGKAPGETIKIAEEMAVKDSLRRLFKLDDCRRPFAFGNEGHRLVLHTEQCPPVTLSSTDTVQSS